jgi:hypothetical protein
MQSKPNRTLPIQSTPSTADYADHSEWSACNKNPDIITLNLQELDSFYDSIRMRREALRVELATAQERYDTVDNLYTSLGLDNGGSYEMPPRTYNYNWQ